jgi:predicted MFS family arabinose efflux permease
MIVAAPLVGLAIEATGRLCTWMLASAAVTAVASFLLAFAEGAIGPHAFVAVLALCNAMFCASIYPALPCTASGDTEGFVYGLVVSSNNLALALVTLIMGRVLDAWTRDGKGLADADGYRTVSIITGCCAVAACVCAAVLMRTDRLGDGILDAAPDARRELLHRRRLLEERQRNAEALAGSASGSVEGGYGAVEMS